MVINNECKNVKFIYSRVGFRAGNTPRQSVALPPLSRGDKKGSSKRVVLYSDKGLHKGWKRQPGASAEV
jgi:hypothetical protein